VEQLDARNRPRVIDTGPLVVRSRPKVIDIRPQVQPTAEGTGARSQTDVGPSLVETGPSASGVSQPSTVRLTKALREVAVTQQRTGVAKENLQKKAFDAIIDGSNVAY
jgi:hypothetical protein